MKTNDDLPLNVTLFEGILRLCVMMWLPFLIYFDGLIIYLLITAYYLMVTAMTSFCPVKYVWQKLHHTTAVKLHHTLEFV